MSVDTVIVRDSGEQGKQKKGRERWSGFAGGDGDATGGGADKGLRTGARSIWGSRRCFFRRCWSSFRPLRS